MTAAALFNKIIMAFEETREQKQMYNLFRSCIYITLILELVMNIPISGVGPIMDFIIKLLRGLKVFNSVGTCKIIEFVCIAVVCIGTTAKKSMKFNLRNMVVIPIVMGAVLTGLCFVFHVWGGAEAMTGRIPLSRWLYAICSIVGVVLIHQGLDAIAKYYQFRIAEDRWNFENESFRQSEKKEENAYSVNVPMIYYWQKKMHKGWINITNPFRGTIILGTPGSGKSFSIIDPFIRQHARKKFAMMVYDYKFPALAETLFYQYCKNKHYGHLPDNCGFYVVNFSDVEHSSRINPIQKKYIPDLAAASETAATLLAALNKGGGEKKGGSEAFFTNSAENFLAAIIYFFVNFHPTGYYRGRKLRHFINWNGRKLEVVIRYWKDYVAVDENGEKVLDFVDEKFGNMSCDDDGMFVQLEGLTYNSKIEIDGRRRSMRVKIDREWWEDENGVERVPDTFTGEYSTMPHVLSLLGKGYKDVFDLLMKDEHIRSLMAPFESAYTNRAMEQLEGMVGTLRVTSARLVSPEAYWVFTGDDFDLQISNREHPAYLVIANDPEKEQVIGSLNAVILNRLVSRVNTKGNLPVSIIVDELPTLYFHKIDRLIGTARSNKVAVTLGFQELPQLESDYGKNGMQKILSTCGNIFMGAARNKETLEWAQNDVFGKVKQTSQSVTINENLISTQLTEKMDYLLPASKIADMATGWLAGQAARDFSATEDHVFSEFDIDESADFKTSKYFCKTHFDMDAIKREEKKYVKVPKFYEFRSEREKEVILNRNFTRVNAEVDCIICEILGKVPDQSLRQIIKRENIRVPYFNNAPSFDPKQ